MSYYSILTEAGFDVDRAYFIGLSEAAQLQVTDEALSGMMKFITDKYNSLDFSEIEKSAGDVTRFKYTQMLYENLDILQSIYEASADPGAKKYVEVIFATRSVLDHLRTNKSSYNSMYKEGNGMVQLLYTTLVAGCIYSIGTLISNTIRFVTTEIDTDCEVLFEEIPGTIRHVHIKNIMAASKDLSTITKLLSELEGQRAKRARVNESVTASGVVAVLAIAAGVIILVPRIIHLIREIIYSVYYSRVKNYEMLEAQIDLIKTNIESLEAGRGSKKVIARQKKIVQKLEKWQNRIAIKMDTTEIAKRTQQKKEDTTLRIDRNSPMVQAAADDASGILI